MDREKVRALLEEVAAGALAPEQALARLRTLPYEDLRFARVDLHRSLRHGVPEAVYCAGKTPEQVVAIVERLAQHHDNVLATRAEPAVAAALVASGLPCRVHEAARLVVVKPTARDGVGLIVVVSAGTSDLPVAEEAAVTAEVMGNVVERLFDCGVAGLHRLVPHLSRSPAWTAPFRACWAASWTGRSSRCPPAWATAPPSAAWPRCSPC